MSSASQPTILVKKADGTTVRMTLDEIKKMKEQRTGAPEHLSTRAPEHLSTRAPEHRSTRAHEHTSTQAPVKRMINNSLPKKISGEPASPRHSERAPASQKREESRSNQNKPQDPSLRSASFRMTNEKPASNTNVNNGGLSAKIIKDSGVSIPAEFFARANSLIESRLKGVRDDDQFTSYALKPAENGGLNLNQAQAERILKQIKNYTEKKEKKLPKPAYPMAKRLFGGSAGALLKTMPADYRVANTTPVKDIFLDEAKAEAKKAFPFPAPLMERQRTQETARGIDSYRNVPKIPQKPAASRGVLIEDIKEEPKQEEKFAGPVDEMKRFTIKDWRRLARSPKDVAEIMYSKFSGWKKESFMLYADCRQTWRESPLAAECRNALVQSINTGAQVQNILKNQPRDSITYEEFLEVERLNARLEM